MNGDSPAPRRNWAVEARGLCLTYANPKRAEPIRAVVNVDLCVERGQHLAIMGRSGSGKTSLLACLSGRFQATGGTVAVDRPVATIHQDLRLVKQRSALKNVQDGALGRLSLWRSLCCYPQEEDQRVRRMLGAVGMLDRAHWPVARLSGGQQQRVAIARALMQDPGLLLADEPVASLDHSNAGHIMALLDRLTKQRQVTLISVLHDVDLARTYADRTVILDAGKVSFDSDSDSWPQQQAVLDAADRPDTQSAQPPSKSEPRPAERARRTKPLRFVGVLLVAGAVYGFAFNGLNIGLDQFREAPASVARFLSDLVPDSAAQVGAIRFGKLAHSLLQTVLMALLGTTFGILLCWPLAALGAKNLGPTGLRPLVRFGLNAVRTVPSLLWGLICVAAVGLGPLAGVLALTAYSVGYLSKFFYEAFEAAEPGPPDALSEIGASGLQRFVHAVWPASKAPVCSSCLFMFEYNIRAASVLGVVGAGGIGADLSRFFAWRDFPPVLACLGMLLAVVVVVDAISTRLRAQLV